MTDFNLVLSQVRQRLEILYQIVDELEAQGGGGGGTSDYTQLENLPKLNSKTITGSHDGSYYGLASTSDLTAYLTSSEAAATYQTLAGMSDYLTSSDAASTYQTQSGMSSYYTKTETDSEITSEITGAINNLDHTAIGGSTKYITTISEANGIIDAEEASPDTVPTTSSTKLITSGGVKTYVDTAETNAKADWFKLGTQIPNNSDLNTYTTPGHYYIGSNSGAATIANTPNDYGGKLIVEEIISSSNYKRQTYYCNTDSTSLISVRRQNSSESGWSEWTTFTTPANVIGMTFGVLNATVIPAAGVDLDTLTTPGIWIVSSTNAAENSSGRPDYANSASKIFRLEVKNMSGTRVFQEMFVYRIGTYEGDFDRYIRMGRTDGTWNTWKHMDTTDVNTYYPTPAASLSSGNELRGAVEEEVEQIEPDEDEPQDER